MPTSLDNNKTQSIACTNLKTHEAARYLNIQSSTLEQYRWRGQGPLYVKIGRSVRYRIADLDAYVEARVFSSTTEAQAAAL